jgi:cell division protein FtsZ
MDLATALTGLLRLAFVQGVIAALLVFAMARAALLFIGVWQRTRRPRFRVTVVGVGGAGGNAVDAMVRAGTRGVTFVAVNTDHQALRQSLAHHRIQLGARTNRGNGTGGDPAAGEAAAGEDPKRLARAVAGADMVFVVAGLGGGTGSGAAPFVAAAAKEHGALTVAIVTRPFGFEGTHRAAIAEQWGAALRDQVDAMIWLPNDLVSVGLAPDASMLEAFASLDALIRQRIEGVVELIGVPGRVNLDPNHVRAALRDGGDTMMGIGRGRGEHGAVEAVRQAVASTPLVTGRGGASRLLLHLAGSSRLAFADVQAAVAELQSVVAHDANVIVGATFERRLKDETVATVIATAFGVERRRSSIGTPLRGRSESAPTVPAMEPSTVEDQAPNFAAAVGDGIVPVDSPLGRRRDRRRALRDVAGQ